MPSSAVRRRTAILSIAIAAAPVALAAQSSAGTDINAAADSGNVRQPLFFGSAALARAGQVGMSLQGMGTWQRFDWTPPLTGASDIRSSAFTSLASLSWGTTSWLTLGGYAARTDARITTEGLAAPIDGGPPTRQGTRIGVMEDQVGMFARLALWRSATGASRVTATGTLRDQRDRSPSGSVGLALQQNLGRFTAHLAPRASFADNASTAYEVDGAIAYALARRTSLSAEVMHFRNGGGGFGPVYMSTDVAAGVRQHLGRLAVDVGARYLARDDFSSSNARRTAALLAAHWSF